MSERGVMKPVIAWMPARRIGFHPGNVCCDGCPYAEADTSYNRDRKRCMDTGEIIYDKKSRGLMCRLEFEEENEDVQKP